MTLQVCCIRCRCNTSSYSLFAARWEIVACTVQGEMLIIKHVANYPSRKLNTLKHLVIFDRGFKVFDCWIFVWPVTGWFLECLIVDIEFNPGRRSPYSKFVSDKGSSKLALVIMTAQTTIFLSTFCLTKVTDNSVMYFIWICMIFKCLVGTTPYFWQPCVSCLALDIWLLIRACSSLYMQFQQSP